MSISRWLRVCFVALLALATLAPAAEAQRGSGKFALEWEGAMTGGVTGIRASYGVRGDAFVIDLPAVVPSYPTVRFTRAAGVPERPAQVEVGSGAGDFAVEFAHPDLPVAYVAQRGTVRVTEVADGRVSGEFMVVAVPRGGGAGQSLTIRGRFDALGGR